MEVDGDIDDDDDAWLLSRLPELPCFAKFYTHVSTALRHACQVENDPATVGLYVRFLVQFAPSELGDMADLCLDMSSIIVERSTILPAIICHPSTHRALLELFTGYMRRLLELGTASAEAFSLVEQRSEAVVVIFHSFDPPKEATLHFFVVHAQIILLTFLPKEPTMSHQTHKDARVAAELHETLLQWWFNRGEAPQVSCFFSTACSFGKHMFMVI